MATTASSPDASASGHRSLWFWLSLMLILAVPLLSAHRRAAEIPFSLLASLAPYLAWRFGRDFWNHAGARLLLALFACYWLPMVAALPDAMDWNKSLMQTLAALRFPLAALSIMSLLRESRQMLDLTAGVAILLGFWAVDALMQQILGYNLLGMPDAYPRLSGMFGSEYLRLGLYSALLLPFLLQQLVPRQGRWPRWLTLMVLSLVLAVIGLSGTRSAWIMTILALALGASHELSRIPRPRWRWAAGLILCLVMIGAGWWSYVTIPSVQERVEQTAQVLSGEPEAVNEALSYRLPIWRHAWGIAREHPINGVGPRGFRSAYSSRVGADDYFIDKEGMGASHAHQLQLAIVTETGFIGLAGFLLGGFWLWRSWRSMPAAWRCLAAPPLIALFLAIFPFNSHVDAYASGPALMFWWLLALYLTALRLSEHVSRPS